MIGVLWKRSARLACLPGALLLLGAELPPRSGVTVVVVGLRNHKGLIQACLTADPVTFPDCDRDRQALHQSVPASGDGLVHFHNVLPGRYAVALFHDENSNGRLDKLLMLPREGFGFSRDAPIHMGPPHFDAAAFTLQGHVAPGDELVAQVRMRYLL